MLTGKTPPADNAASAQSVRRLFTEGLVPLALEGLRQMVLPDGRAFCHKARRGQGPGLLLVGESKRYSAMTLIGLALQEQLGCRGSSHTEPICHALFEWALHGASLGDVGLVLWALSIRKDPRAEQVGQIVAAREEELGDRTALSVMSLGWLLTGLSLAIRRGLGGKDLPRLAERTSNLLLANQNGATGLFRFAGESSRYNVFRKRVNSRLGSFASQVYPTVGLAYHAMTSGAAEPLSAAVKTADAICRLQGVQGQWWWIYDVQRGFPVIRYPVYGVHQDGMGPMALLAVSRIANANRDYSLAVAKSLQWLTDHPELPGEPLVDSERSVIWRAIQRDMPTATAGFGLGRGERLRMHLAGWQSCEDSRPFVRGYVCDECRPYHLGWLLVAAFLACAEDGAD